MGGPGGGQTGSPRTVHGWRCQPSRGHLDIVQYLPLAALEVSCKEDKFVNLE